MSIGGARLQPIEEREARRLIFPDTYNFDIAIPFAELIREPQDSSVEAAANHKRRGRAAALRELPSSHTSPVAASNRPR